MFTRFMPREKETVAEIIQTVFPDFVGNDVQRINRGISNIKYWLTCRERRYVIKIYSGDRHQQRAAAEFSVMSLAHDHSDIGVPEPVAWGGADDLAADRPISYVVMTGVDGTPLDEVINLLTMDQVASIGAQTGILLDRLHALAHRLSASPEDRRIRRIPRQRSTSLAQLADQARAVGVLTDDQNVLVVRWGSASIERRPSVLLHGDLGWDNIIVHTSPVPRLVALVDFEHSTLGAAEYDFVKSSVVSGERANVFTAALMESYARVQRSTLAVEAFRANIVRAEVVTDLSVAVDLARDPLRDVYAMATTEHRAWQHVARLYRALAMDPAGRSGDARSAAVRRTLELAQGSTCRVRQVGAAIFDPDGNEVTAGINDLRPEDGQCWCTGAVLDRDGPRCPARHAEANAIRSAAARGMSLHDLTMICSTCPCLECARHIVRAGLREVLYIDDYIDTKGLDYLLAAGVVVHRVPGN
ncbi:phosphotransferase [Micromonospora sp. NPDC047527]|uniref:phosphotransferase n=1 Tax=Micromonospora sp. NPDC047527 TaxID=3155144 RepID=UPI0033C49F59